MFMAKAFPFDEIFALATIAGLAIVKYILEQPKRLALDLKGSRCRGPGGNVMLQW